MATTETRPAPLPTGLPGIPGLFDPPFVADPFPTLAALRSTSPVHFDPDTGLWLVSRYADVRSVLLDPGTYLPDNAQHSVTPLPVRVLRTLARAGFSLPPALANNRGADHADLRRLVMRFFNAERVAAAVPTVEQTAAEMLSGPRSRYAAGGRCDLAAEYARLLPCRVMMRLLGIDGVSASTLATWSDAALELFYGRPPADRQLHLAEQVGAFHQWLTAQVSSAAATDGLIGGLRRHRKPDGTPLDAATAVAVCFFVFIAGQSTTGQLISTALLRAVSDPQVWSRVAREDGFAEAWVEEILRREPPVTTWRRVTARETELSGVRLPAGAQLLLMLMGTGSDPEVFDDPERLCPHRENIRHHLAFGAGRHRCLGASLARTEAAVALRAAARALPDAALVEPGTQPPMLGLLSFRAPLQVVVHRHSGR
ncbi:cytochrome P450 [Streptomyces sp. PKU-EA00015]|uniref:cytochrome P450 n=1 Tax=Streptomyces sp. PKU-EA00015 TaxID=2748326 RepID=UPI00281148F7|nr:cytochrome P450 [Streptomyces sp. PKU-EA00015]